MNPKVDFYFTKNTRWQQEIRQLRNVLLGCGLNEQLKWGVPCYTYPIDLAGKKNETNIVLIHVFKEYCALLFFKGALLQEAAGILVQQTENVQAARQVRFTGLKEVAELTPTLKAYVFEAIEVEKRGMKVDMKSGSESVFPQEFTEKLAANKALKVAFELLTPGRQRGYNLFFSAPKQTKTRTARIDKCIPAILEGKGLND